MTRKVIYALVFLFSALYVAAPAFASEESPNKVSAAQIRAGCSILLSKAFHPAVDDPLSVPPYDVVATWFCEGGEYSRIDTYERNGGSPEVVTVTYWKGRDIAVLIKWSINSQASDYVGDYYKVFLYRGVSRAGQQTFVKDEAAMGKFPAGWDGYTRSGSPVHYPFKSAGAIKKRLRAIHFDE